MLLTKGNQVGLIHDFISANEHDTLLAWAETQYQTGRLKPNPHGAHRFYATHDMLSNIPSEFWTARERGLRLYEITSHEEEPTYKCFLGCNLDGGFVHTHRDRSKRGKLHFRLNLMLSRPEDGGVPIIGRGMIPVRERGCGPSFRASCHTARRR